MFNESMSNDNFDNILKEIWTYLAPAANPAPTDIIFVFGGLDLSIPNHASELFKTGNYQYVVISGAEGPLTSGVFSKSEARTFADVMTSAGVPEDRILLEEQAKNTGENVKYGMRRAQEAGLKVISATLVSKSFLMRRALLTFSKQFPQIATLPSPPPGPPSAYLDRPKLEFAQRLIGEIDRLVNYERLGFIAHADIPSRVEEAVKFLRVVVGAK